MYPIIIKEVSALIIGAIIVIGGLSYPAKQLTNLGFDDGNYKGKWGQYEVEAKVDEDVSKGNIENGKVKDLVIKRNGKVVARYRQITREFIKDGEPQTRTTGRWIKKDEKLVRSIDEIVHQLEKNNLSKQTYDQVLDNKLNQVLKMDQQASKFLEGKIRSLIGK